MLFNCSRVTVEQRRKRARTTKVRGSQSSPSPMRNGEMSMMCLTDVRLMPRAVRYLDHRTKESLCVDLRLIYKLCR